MSSTLTARSAVVHQRVNATVRIMRLDVSRDVVDSRLALAFAFNRAECLDDDDDDDETRTRRHRSRLAMMMMTMTRAWRARVMVDARM